MYYDQPAIARGNLDARLKEHFGPRVAETRQFWRLDHGPLRDEILRNREHALASLSTLEDIAARNGVVIEDCDGQYFLTIDDPEKVPQGWSYKVHRSGTHKQCLPIDQNQRTEIKELCQAAYKRPQRCLDDHMLRQICAVPFEEMNKFPQKDDVASVEIVGDEIYIQTSRYNPKSFPDWISVKASDYYLAVAKELAKRESAPAPSTIRQFD